ncbi:MAG: hypothetical protein WC389_22320 [Lutibacter sp.]|jgi:hypothetical protein
MKPEQINKNFQVGDRVQYSHAFLKSINAYTEDICFDVGTIQSSKYYPQIKKTTVKVLWDSDNEVRSSLSQNLTLIGRDITE